MSVYILGLGTLTFDLVFVIRKCEGGMKIFGEIVRCVPLHVCDKVRRRYYQIENETCFPCTTVRVTSLDCYDN